MTDSDYKSILDPKARLDWALDELESLRQENSRLREALQSLSDACLKLDTVEWVGLTKVDEMIIGEVDHYAILARAALNPPKT